MITLIAITNGIIFLLYGTGTIKAEWTVNNEKEMKIKKWLVIIGIIMIVLAIVKVLFNLICRLKNIK